MKGPDRKYQEVVKIHQQIGLVVIRIVLEPSQVTAHSLSHFMQSAIYTFKLYEHYQWISCQQSVNQSMKLNQINQSINQSISQSINESIKQSTSTVIKQWINHTIHQPTIIGPT